MTDFLAAFPATPPQRAWNPLPTVPRDNLERLDLEFQAGRLTQNSDARERALYEAYEVGRAAYRAAGQDLPNPYAGFWRSPIPTPGSLISRARIEQPRQDAAFAAWDDAHERLSREDPGAVGALPSRAEIEARAAARARGAFDDAQAASAIGGGGVGGFVGQIGAALTDPWQLVTLPFGAPWRLAGAVGTRIATTAAIEGTIAAGTQAIVETQAAPWRVQIGIPDQSAENIGMAFAGGAVLGGGLRAVAEGVRAVWGRAPLPPGHPGADAQTTAMLADAQIRSDLANAAGPERAEAHRAAADAAGEAVAAGRIAQIEREVADIRAAYRRVLATPIGPADDPLVQLTPDEIGLVLLRRGPVNVENGEISIRSGRDAPDGLIKILWRHGAMSRTEPAFRVTEEDVLALPVVLREFEPRPGSKPDNLEFRVARQGEDGAERQVVYVVGPLRERADGAQQVVTIYVQEPGRPGKDAPLSMRRAGDGASPSERSERSDGIPRGTLLLGRSAGPPSPAGGNMAGGGARFNTYTPAGRAVLVEPQVMELDSLIPSHLEDGQLNPAYPHAEGVQPRDRGAAPSRDQVRAIAAALNPDRLRPNAEAGFGAPIVAVDNVVESGNGRVMALRTAFGDPALAEQAGAYRAWLERQGFDLTGFERPVLVSRRVSALSPTERQAFVREANGRGTLAQAAAEQARQDARALDDALPLWRGGDVDSQANAPFVQRFLSALTAEERGSLIRADRTLSAEGARRIQAAILARAYGDELGPLLERFLEADADGLKAIAGALGDVAGRWAQLRADVAAGLVNPAMDVTADLAAAVRTVDNARRLKMPVADLLAQGDLDAPPLTDAAMALLATMFREPGFRAPAGRERLVARLSGFLEEAEKSRPGPDLFGAGPAAPGDVLAVAARRGDLAAPTETGQRGPLAAPQTAPEDVPATPLPTFAFDPPAPAARAAPGLFDAAPLDPEAVTRAAVLDASRAAEAARQAAAAALPDATLAQARRIAAARDIPVPAAAAADDAAILSDRFDVAGDGATRGARELLDEADDQVTAAAEAGACLLGAAT